MLNGTPRILIIRLSAIGDVVRVLPALHVIRAFNPYAQIDWAVEAKAADVVRGHPALDQVHVFERPKDGGEAFSQFRAFCRLIRSQKYEVTVDFHGLFKSGWLAYQSGAKERHGFARPRAQEGSHFFVNRSVKLPKDAILNRVEENLLLADNLAPRPEHLSHQVYVPPETQEHVDAFIEETFGDNKFLIGLHAPVERQEKQWPLSRFAELSDMLVADGRFHVMLTWGPGQFGIVEEVMRLSRRKPAIAPETPDLNHYAWLAHRMDLYVGGDTGPMHIAAAMGTPCVAVFGGTDPRRHAPFGVPHTILCKASNPERLTLPQAHAALAEVTAEEMYDACVGFIHRHELAPGHMAAMRP